MTLPKSNGKVALLTGVAGQDGSYLAAFLLAMGYSVHSIKRWTSLFNNGRIEHLFDCEAARTRRFVLNTRDMTDSSSLTLITWQVRP